MFNKARIKLTLWYLGIIMTISLSFSIVIFKVAENEIERFSNLQKVRIQKIYPFPQPVIIIDNTLVEETKHRLIINLALINSGILIISGLSGYALSGFTLKPIKEMLDDQKRFISDASHEINTPLTSLKTAMEVFLRSKKKTIVEASTLVKESITEVNKLQSLSTSLLELSRYEKVNTTSKLQNVSIKNILKNAIKNINPLAKNKNIKIILLAIDIKLKGNASKLESLFTILLDNAVKYSHKNSFIKIVAQKNKKTLEIKVSDHGIGIKQTDLIHIFDRFYRSDSARSSNGYGLGLSIAKKIVEMHSGTISVNSLENKGTTFTIKLPL